MTTSSNRIPHETILAVASQSSVEGKFAKEMKQGMKDRRVSKNVRVLQLIAVVIGLIIITVSSVEYALLYNNLERVRNLFSLSRDAFNRVTSVMLIASYLRLVRTIALYCGGTRLLYDRKVTSNTPNAAMLSSNKTRIEVYLPHVCPIFVEYWNRL